jgi:uncharacterized protein YbjT (DUF2867 family)
MPDAAPSPPGSATAETPARWSLRTRLLVLLVSSIAVVFSVGTVQSYRAQREVAQDLFDGSLRETARLLLQLAQHEITEHGLVLGVALLNAEVQPGPYDFRYQIWTDDMRSAYRTANLPATPLMSIHAEGLDWTVVEGERWRAFAAWNEAHTLQIQIAQSQARRRDLDRTVLLRVLANIAIVMVGASVFVWLIVNASLRPLQATARAVAQRSAGDLRPIDAGHAPVEVRPLLDALNRLLARIRDALATRAPLHRRCRARAAHAAGGAARAVGCPARRRPTAARQEAEARLGRGLDRMDRLVTQMLALSRLEATDRTCPPRADRPGRRWSSRRSAGAAAGRPAPHGDPASRSRATAGAASTTRSGSFPTAAASSSAALQGDAGLLAVLLRNLLDNARAESTLVEHSRLVHYPTEQAIRASGLGFTLLRHALYAEILVGDLKATLASGVFRRSGGQARCAYIAREDLGLSAAQVLMRDEPSGRTYNETMERTWSGDEIAALMSEVFGRPVRYEAVPAADWPRYMTETWGVPPELSKSVLGTMQAIEAGEFDLVSADYAAITGHPPRTLQAFLEGVRASGA